jgi:hypothetical protein
MAPPSIGPEARPIEEISPQAAGAAPLRPGREHVGDQRQRTGEQRGRAEPLYHPRRDKDPHRGRRRAGRTSEAEDRQTSEEACARADPVGQRPGAEQEGGEGDRVAAYDPLGTGERAAEVADDRAQGDVHDRRVERDHQGAEAERGEAEPPRVKGRHGHWAILSKWFHDPGPRATSSGPATSSRCAPAPAASSRSRRRIGS